MAESIFYCISESPKQYIKVVMCNEKNKLPDHDTSVQFPA